MKLLGTWMWNLRPLVAAPSAGGVIQQAIVVVQGIDMAND